MANPQPIRLASRLAAALVCGLLVLAALSTTSTIATGGAPGIVASIEVFSAAPPRRPVIARRERPTPSLAHLQSDDGASGDALPLLWTYSSDGRIVFARAEHYQRCVAARGARRDEADCPNAHETRALALAKTPERAFTGLSFSALEPCQIRSTRAPAGERCGPAD